MEKITVYIAAASFVIVSILIIIFLIKEFRNMDGDDK